MFLVKKLVSAFLMPMPLGLGILLCGLWCLWRRRFRSGTLLATGAFVWLTVVAMPPLMSRPLSALEAEIPAQESPESVAYIVVLGNRHFPNTDLPEVERLSGAARARLVKGIYLYQRNPGARLIFSGYAGLGRAGHRSHAEIMQQAAIQLGVPPQDIVIEPTPRDTFEEAQAIAARVGQTPFLLVTDASHMPRSVALFRGQGCRPIPAPTNYTATGDATTALDWFPKAAGLRQAERYWHETLGRIWARMTAQL